MKYLHSSYQIGPSAFIEVTLDGQANVMLLDNTNYSAYRRGQAFRYFGGWATRSPVRLTPPVYGHWHLVIDLGGYTGTISAKTRVLKNNSVPIVR